MLGQELPWLDNVTQAKTPARLPVVLTREEVRAVLARLSGRPWLLASLMYGTGLRVMEAVRLRVKDVEFTRREIVVRDGKGAKDHVTILSGQRVEPLRNALAAAARLHESDLAAGHGRLDLPHALARKYPRADRERGWQYVFPSDQLAVDPRAGREGLAGAPAGGAAA